MPRVLNLFDVSPFIHAGHVNKYSFLENLVDTGVTARTLRTPTGGTSLIFNTIYDIAGEGDMVFCCDRNPVIKKEMLPGYKGNRNHKHEIEIEKQAAEYILKKCNGTVLAYDGYEADDIIYTLVRKLHNNYDKIWIYTGDSDLYFLVDDIVGVKPSSSKAKYVTRENYEEVIKKDSRIPYNTMTLSKIVYGDTSDCIPALPKELRVAFEQRIYSDPDIFPLMGDKATVKSLCNLISPLASKQADIVFPLEIEDVQTTFTALDTAAVRIWGSLIRNKYFRGCTPRDFDATSLIEEMHSLGIYLEE